jgi:hypothetical protein
MSRAPSTNDNLPGAAILRASKGVYALAVGLGLLVLLLRDDGALLFALIAVPIFLLGVALLTAPFVFLFSMLWGIWPLDLVPVRWAIKRNFRWIVSGLLWSGAVGAILRAWF